MFFRKGVIANLCLEGGRFDIEQIGPMLIQAIGENQAVMTLGDELTIQAPMPGFDGSETGRLKLLDVALFGGERRYATLAAIREVPELSISQARVNPWAHSRPPFVIRILDSLACLRIFLNALQEAE